MSDNPYQYKPIIPRKSDPDRGYKVDVSTAFEGMSNSELLAWQYPSVIKKLQVKVEKLPHYPENTPLPMHQTNGAAAVDLIAAISKPHQIWGNDTYVCPTGLRMEIPFGYFGAIVPRSGLGIKGLIVANIFGVIDSDYRGEVIVTLKNLGYKYFDIEPGMRIAQMLIMRHEYIEFVEGELSDTTRGDGKHGSTGV